MDELLKQALERRRRLLAELDVVNKLIEVYQELGAVVAPERRSEQLRLFSPEGSRATQAAAVAAMIADAENMIAAEGRPMTRSELVQRLEQAGHEVEGKDKVKVFGTNAWRSGRFHNLKGKGYWPKSMPLPPELEDVEIRPSMVG